MPTALSRFGLGRLGAARPQISGDQALVLSDGLRVLDIHTPSNPLPQAMYDLHIHGLAVAGPYALLVLDDNGLRIVQIHPERFRRPLLLPLLRRS